MNPPPRTAPDCQAAATRLVQYFETLSPDTLHAVSRYYAADARFKDPFNDVHGPGAIAAIFAHMFDTLEQPHFVVTTQVVQGNACFMGWEFRFGFRRFKAGQPHGHGRRVEANGDVYVGDWCVAAVARQRDVRQG